MEHGLRLSVAQCSLPGQFCILLFRFVDGFHPDASLEAVPAIAVRRALELSVLRLAKVDLLLVWNKSVVDCLNKFAPQFLVYLVPLLAEVALQSLHQLLCRGAPSLCRRGSPSFAAR